MKSAAITIAALVALAGCDTATSAADQDDSNTVTEVTAMLETWSAAGEGDNFEALASLYADEQGFAWIERGAVAYQDHDAIIAGLEAAKAMNIAIDNEISEISVTPLANDAAAFHAALRSNVAADSFSFSFDGVISGVAVKRGGAWRLLQGAFSAKQTDAAQ